MKELKSLKRVAAASGSSEDAMRYRQKRDQVVLAEVKAMADYFAENPGRARLCEKHFCEPCDKEFPTPLALEAHQDEHEVCGLDDCKFAADKDAMHEHVMLIHASGLYARMKKGSSKEESDKWRVERKKCYPTTEIVAKAMAKLEVKRKQQEAMYERMLEEAEETRQEKMAARMAERKVQMAIRSKSQETRQRRKERQLALGLGRTAGRQKRVLPQMNDDSDDSDPEGWCSGVPMFCGTTNEEEKDAIASQVKEATDALIVEDDDDDDGPPEEIPIVNDTSEQFEQGDGSSDKFLNDSIVCGQPAEGEDVGPPEDIPTVVSKEIVEEEQLVDHEPPSQMDVSPPARSEWRPAPSAKPGQAARMNNMKRLRRPPTLLENLLKGEICKERSELLQCVKFICQKNFFRDDQGQK